MLKDTMGAYGEHMTQQARLHVAINYFAGLLQARCQMPPEPCFMPDYMSILQALVIEYLFRMGLWRGVCTQASAVALAALLMDGLDFSTIPQ